MSDAARRLSLLRRDLHDLVATLNADPSHWPCVEQVKKVLDRDRGRIGGKRAAWTSESPTRS